MPAFLAGQILTADLLNAAVPQEAWTSFTPTWTNLTVGNGTLDCNYVQIGKLVTANYRLLFGSTTAITGAPVSTLPVTGATTLVRGQGAVAQYRDDSATTSYPGLVLTSGTTILSWFKLNVAGANDQASALSSTTPFTWTVNDVLGCQITYEAA